MDRPVTLLGRLPEIQGRPETLTERGLGTHDRPFCLTERVPRSDCEPRFKPECDVNSSINDVLGSIC